MTSTQLASAPRTSRCSSASTATSTAPRATCRRRSTRARRPARQPAQQPHLPQGQPGRRADHDPRADLGHADAGPDLRRGPTIICAALSQVGGVGDVNSAAARCRRCASSSTPTRSPATASALEDVRAAISAANANRPKGMVEDGERRWQIYSQRPGRRPSDYAPLIIAYRNGAAVRLGDVADVDDAVENVRNAGLSNGQPAVFVTVYRQPRRQRHRDGRPGEGPAAASCRPPARRHRRCSRDRPHDHHPRLAARGRATLCIAVAAGHARGLLFLRRRAGDADPGRGRARVADRHFRRDVSAGLQPRQPLADGADQSPPASWSTTPSW